ncbi:MAG: aminotransferase class I/II-fold pyridoxal phosphate-dependent enzyme [Clostridia bacterium]|nr:aminotransferase class I/II-fold pyridoxal phosphate-dependent enzyme [Clostridia bacterium]
MISQFSKEEWSAIYRAAKDEFSTYCNRCLDLDMSRGKPSSLQLDVTEGMLKVLQTNADCYGEDGTDYRNYGILDGIPEARKLFADIFEVPEKNVVVGGNSSLNMMYDSIVTAMLFGVPGSVRPWCREDKVRWLCPAPGYDRHFAICESLGIEMIPIEMTADGPDMDKIEALCAEHNCIKGMWCVPKYSNPEGKTYSDETVRRLASMKAAPDFRIYWDNAYIVHDLGDKSDKLLNLFDECVKAGNPNRVMTFTSTSKISFPGAGVAAMATSAANIKALNAVKTYQTIGPDKLNQLRHVKYFKNKQGIIDHMKKHAEYLRPQFDVALAEMNAQLKEDGYATWTVPNGGYFLSLDLQDASAKRVEELMKQAGVKITPAGSSFPYHHDPKDRNLRIAPTYPPVEELKTCIQLLCVCIKLATAENHLK